MNENFTQIVAETLRPYATEWSEIQLLKGGDYETCTESVLKRFKKSVRFSERAIISVFIMYCGMPFVMLLLSTGGELPLLVETQTRFAGVMIMPALIMVPQLIRARDVVSKLQTLQLVTQAITPTETMATSA